MTGQLLAKEKRVRRGRRASRRCCSRRTRLRPDREYTPVTEAEWDEFEGHFDKRKVELGQCGRPYATPCVHEHACLRCPMLRIDPKMLHRLDELEVDLNVRRDHASAQGWLGELEGLDLSLRFLAEKRGEVGRLRHQPPLITIGSRAGRHPFR